MTLLINTKDIYTVKKISWKIRVSHRNIVTLSKTCKTSSRPGTNPWHQLTRNEDRPCLACLACKVSVNLRAWLRSDAPPRCQDLALQGEAHKKSFNLSRKWQYQSQNWHIICDQAPIIAPRICWISWSQLTVKNKFKKSLNRRHPPRGWKSNRIFWTTSATSWKALITTPIIPSSRKILTLVTFSAKSKALNNYKLRRQGKLISSQTR